MKEITLDATIANVRVVTEFVDEILEQYGCPPKAEAQIDIAIDELFSNIANYGYINVIGKATVKVEIEEEHRLVRITFIDSGIPYNPLEKEDPDINLSAEERRIGGLGIFMVKKSMDKMFYEFKNGQNVLSIEKKF